MGITEIKLNRKPEKPVNDLLDDIVNEIWTMPITGNMVVTEKHSHIISDVARIKEALGLTLDIMQPEKKPELTVFTHDFQLSDTYFGAFKNRASFIKCGMKRGGINFRIENHEIRPDSKEVSDKEMYKYAMKYPNTVFYTPVRFMQYGFKPQLWVE
jgi:hypothetical protein